MRWHDAVTIKKSKNKREYLFTASDRFDEHPDKIRAVKNKRFKYPKNYPKGNIYRMGYNCNFDDNIRTFLYLSNYNYNLFFNN